MWTLRQRWAPGVKAGRTARRDAPANSRREHPRSEGTAPVIISLHMPKTAGNSFLNALRQRFHETLLLDYGDMNALQAYFAGAPSGELAIPVPMEQLRGIACTHGHFLAPKYGAFAAQPDHRFVTWLRDPVQRLCSHYFFWRRTYDPATSGPLFRKVVEEDWSLERFCLCAEYRNIYTKYLCGFPRERFDFIGIMEHYDADLAYLGNTLLGMPVASDHANRNRGQTGGYTIDSGLRAEIEAVHAADYALYRFARDLRERRD